jgi:hypothetical protein
MNRQIIACLITIFFFLACEVGEDFIPDNTLDPSNPDYIPPQVTITASPTEGQIVSSAQITFTWEGNSDEMSYRYSFDDIWTNWQENVKSVTIKHIDEGSHQFSVKSSYINGDSSEAVSVNFSVDAVEGPSLLFNPRYKKSAVGQTFQLSLIAEEVTNLSGAEVTLTYDAETIEIVDVLQGQLFKNLGGDIIFIIDHSPSMGKVVISTAVWGAGKPAASGSKSLAEIQVKLKKAGNTTIGIDASSKFRNPENKTIHINQIIEAIVESE